MSLQPIFETLRKGADALGCADAAKKNAGLLAVQKSLTENIPAILEANAKDVAAAREKGMKESLVDRLSLNEQRLTSIISCITTIIQQTDPIGQVPAGWTAPNGMQIKQVRVPLGVAAIIYESRPNVTVDAFAIAYKSGNAILLRGSSSALESNKAIVKAIKEGLASCKEGIPDAVALADSGSRDEVDEILTAKGYIDVALPRGGAGLIKMVVEKATVPVIETGSGICHLYIDDSGDIKTAVDIAENAKLQRPGVCNAIEVMLVHKDIAEKVLPAIAERFNGRAEFRCDPAALAILEAAAGKKAGSDEKGAVPAWAANTKLTAAGDDDFDTEFLDYILAIKTVSGVEEAVEHINAHNTKHSECIVTTNTQHARYFQKKVDAACVYTNVSTRFTDGEMFGFGAELGISTQKMHIRGPMGLAALTTTKYIIEGEGQIR